MVPKVSVKTNLISIMTLLPKIVLIVIFGLIGYIGTEENNFFNLNLKSNNKYVDCSYQRCGGYCNKKYCKINSSCRPINRTSKLRQLDIYFHEGIKLEPPILIEISAFKKFGTQYRPLMFTTKNEFCKHLLMKEHPAFAFFRVATMDGNLFDPCPISGHRHEGPKYTGLWVSTLVPTGEWRIDFILSKVINGKEEHILTSSDYYLIKAKDATEF